ncbi:hypothetical protein [Psychrobacter sp. DAB_AL62B]|uniref:hypothetical protein n=1 Tax=Psychrobacter sp. DAB_AL62B TaxID=1028420 RepID=UPI00238187C6|nr:hypothetical protein [Psychrobacter sp. DAB_AL62B]MDE4455213.1 hypothetical protein [Psychrobacter sp. DAB_AL62B]
MNLFDPIVAEDKQHKNFASIIKLSKEADRIELIRWCNGFPDRDNKFVKEFQATFNSSFWEIYLYALFKELNFKMDWSYPSPDFLLEYQTNRVIVEATIAANALGKTPEWEREILEENITRFKKMNIESIIRLSNSIASKHQKYKKTYSKLSHVNSNPFVLAVAPFEQPNFNLQLDIPIMTLLYDYYIDEDAYNDNPHLYPNGPPKVSLGSVEKDNGSKVKLGLFEDASHSDISAIILSTTATWGKVEAMSSEAHHRHISTVWWSEEECKPILKSSTTNSYSENIKDGLYVFHNPFAKNPIESDMFRHEGVTQVFINPTNKRITKEVNGLFLLHRQTINILRS